MRVTVLVLIILETIVQVIIVKTISTHIILCSSSAIITVCKLECYNGSLNHNCTSCDCHMGYTGDFCNITNHCDSSTDRCSGNGVCTNMNDRFECACQTGYAGEDCNSCGSGYDSRDDNKCGKYTELSVNN